MRRIDENYNKYKELKRVSDEIIQKYRKKVKESNTKRKKQIKINNYAFPHIANFDNEDFVINLMGINPNQDNLPIEPYESKELDLYYAYGIYRERYICKNGTYVTSQYNFWNKPEYQIFKKLVKMSWEKYDEDFLKKFYGEEKGEEYNRLITNLRKRREYQDIIFEPNKYFIFSDLYYITGRTQKEIRNELDEEIYELIKDLFYKQIEYYKAKLTIVANESASNIVLERIIKKDSQKWQRVILEGDLNYKEYSNIYRLKNTNSYIYLSTRYYDKMGTTLRKTFAKEIRKLLDGRIASEEDLKNES